jgi:2'-5' RNA ligase
VPTENLHITLAFLGNVDARQQDCVERIAEAIVSPSFEFTLDHFGYRPGSRVLWFAPSEVSAPLMLLANVLSAGARECGLSLDARPYRPHLTLMRKVAREPENYSVGALLWPASNFVLVRSVSVPQGVFYDVLREWPLDSVN